MENAAGQVFRENKEEWKTFADFEQEDSGVSTTTVAKLLTPEVDPGTKVKVKNIHNIGKSETL